MAKLASRVVAAIGIFSLSGCGLVGGLFHTAPNPVVSSTPQAPFRMKVSDESYNGELLVVQGTVTGEIDWVPSDVALRLVGYRDGKAVGSSSASVAVLAGENGPTSVVDAGGALPFSISLTDRDLSNYQIELLWGREALSVVAPRPVPLLHSIRTVVEECSPNDACETQYRVSAVVRNETDEILRVVTLGVSYGWAPDGGLLQSSPSLEGEEELVEVADLAIKPGGERQLSLVVPFVPLLKRGGRFEPVVRLVAGSSRRRTSISQTKQEPIHR